MATLTAVSRLRAAAIAAMECGHPRPRLRQSYNLNALAALRRSARLPG